MSSNIFIKTHYALTYLLSLGRGRNEEQSGEVWMLPLSSVVTCVGHKEALWIKECEFSPLCGAFQEQNGFI
jgi:hypothetical protein